ncbi:DUF2069 domain-containing protein [Colwelliaceae bacterium BS250]
MKPNTEVPNNAEKNTVTQRITTKNLRIISLVGYIGLIIFMPLWLFVLFPSEGLSPTLSFLMFILPLLLPLKGMLQGNPYTFAWANFIVLIYFMHSLTTLWVGEGERVYAAIELILATMMFLGGAYYSKYKGQELGLKIPKLKADLEKEKQQHLK